MMTALGRGLQPEAFRGIVDVGLVRRSPHHVHLVVHDARADPVEGGGHGFPLAPPVGDALLRARAEKLAGIGVDALARKSSRAKAPNTPQSITSVRPARAPRPPRVGPGRGPPPPRGGNQPGPGMARPTGGGKAEGAPRGGDPGPPPPAAGPVWGGGPPRARPPPPTLRDPRHGRTH